MRFKFGELDQSELEIPFSISEQHLEEIARSFVRETRLVDERDQQLKTNKIGSLREQSQSITGEPSKENILHASVVLGRQIDRIPVRGIGGFIMVNIAADGSVVGGHKVWRPLGAKIERGQNQKT